ncbi:MAG: HK97 gp10 family phage protein [Bacteroidales bacterium]|nr:HK97 gp10 family phage protein [Bacteroidales bacterium]
MAKFRVDNYTVNAGTSLRDGMSFFNAHMDLLSAFNDELDEELQEAIHEVGKSTRSDLRSNSPKRTGAYSRSWGCDFFDKEGHHQAVVSNRKFWTLTHLLEDGHDTKNQYGGPYGHVGPADPDHHLRQAQERGIRKLEQLLGIGGA